MWWVVVVLLGWISLLADTKDSGGVLLVSIIGLLACGCVRGMIVLPREADPSSRQANFPGQPKVRLVENTIAAGIIVLGAILFAQVLRFHPLPVSPEEGRLALSAQILYETGSWSRVLGEWQGFSMPAVLLPCVALFGEFSSTWRYLSPLLFFCGVLGVWQLHGGKRGKEESLLLLLLLLLGTFPVVFGQLQISPGSHTAGCWLGWWFLVEEYRQSEDLRHLMAAMVFALICVDTSLLPQIAALVMLLASWVLTLGRGRRWRWSLFMGGFAVGLLVVSLSSELTANRLEHDTSALGLWFGGLLQEFSGMPALNADFFAGSSLVESLWPLGLGLCLVRPGRRLTNLLGFITALTLSLNPAGSLLGGPFLLFAVVMLLASLRLVLKDAAGLLSSNSSARSKAFLAVSAVLTVQLAVIWYVLLSVPLHAVAQDPTVPPLRMNDLRRLAREIAVQPENATPIFSPTIARDPRVAASLFYFLPEVTPSGLADTQATFFDTFDPLVSLYYWPSPLRTKTLILDRQDWDNSLVQNTLETYFKEVRHQNIGGWQVLTLPARTPPWGQGLLGSYYRKGSEQAVMERVDPMVVLEPPGRGTTTPMRIVWSGSLFVPYAEDIVFRLRFRGNLRWEMNGVTQINTDAPNGLEIELPIALEAGFHPLDIAVEHETEWPEVSWEWAPSWTGDFSPVSKAFLVPGPDPRVRFSR